MVSNCERSSGSTSFRVLVLCTANVCRSPLAAVLMREHLRAHESSITIESAGILVLESSPMCEGAACFAGVDLRAHESREATFESLDSADLILTADRTQRAWAARQRPDSRSRTLTLRQAAQSGSWIAGQIAAGEVPPGADPLPSDQIARLRWLVQEMNAARALAGAHAQDVQDRHGPADHTPTFTMVGDVAADIANAMLLVLASK